MHAHKHIHTKNEKYLDVSIHYKTEIKDRGVENYRLNIHLSVLRDKKRKRLA